MRDPREERALGLARFHVGMDFALRDMFPRSGERAKLRNGAGLRAILKSLGSRAFAEHMKALNFKFALRRLEAQGLVVPQSGRKQ